MHGAQLRATRRPITTGVSVTHGRLGKQPTTQGKRRTCPMCGTSCPVEAVCIVCFEPMESRRRFHEEELAA